VQSAPLDKAINSIVGKEKKNSFQMLLLLPYTVSRKDVLGSVVAVIVSSISKGRGMT